MKEEEVKQNKIKDFYELLNKSDE
jgi:hypothetical protein